MSQITQFMFEELEIRTITNEAGDPWFVLRDVLAAMVRRLRRQLL